MGATLLIMAAGMGSRYGGNKQVDGLGPNGEILMEYSIYDAIRAGFDHVVFVIKPGMQELIAGICGDRIAKKVRLTTSTRTSPAFLLFIRFRPSAPSLLARCTRCSSPRTSSISRSAC